MSPTSASTEPRQEAGSRTRTSWVRVCRLEDLTPDRGAAALVGRHQVAIFLLSSPLGEAPAQDGATDAPSGSEVYAIDNRDPYSGANVMARGLVGSAGDEPMVASPIYKQRFSLWDGSCLDGDEAVRSWPVRVMDGWVEVGSE